MNQETVKILLIRLSSIGDILLTTPFIRQIRKQYPAAQIDFLIKNEFKELVAHNPKLNHVYLYDAETGVEGLKKLVYKFNTVNYTHIFDLHNNFRSKYIRTKVKHAAKSKIKKDKIKRALLVYTKINRYKQINSIPDRYRKVGQPLSIKDDSGGLELFWKKEDEISANRVSNSITEKSNTITLAPGAGYVTKQWPLSYFKELIKLIKEKSKMNVLILGSIDERKEFNQLADGDRVKNLAGKLTLLESAATIKQSRIVVCNDSGLMHMSTAVKTPVIAIFGSTVKELGFYPYRSKSFVFENEEIKCRPCSHLGKDKCPKDHFYCMMTIEPHIVFNKIIEMTSIQ